jgi:hypothetical protein
MKLYFVAEKKEELSIDPMHLIKLDLVKENTINEYNTEINKIKRKIESENQNGERVYEKKLEEIQKQVKENSQLLTDEMQNNLLNEKRVEQIGDWV